jgi:hypothetical protein
VCAEGGTKPHALFIIIWLGLVTLTGGISMGVDNLANDTAVATTRALLDELFWPVPEEYQDEIGQQIYDVLLPAMTYLLATQREELLRRSTN